MRDSLLENSFLAKKFKDSKILITGHTGFKGSWLSKWLHSMGAEIVGISIDIPSKPSHFEALNYLDKFKDIRLDLLDLNSLKSIFAKEKPDFVFHLAAQSIVKESFDNPIKTWHTNTIGTVNILESLKEITNDVVAIFITSDKCYDNLEWCWGYKETDKLGGPDPYSASKGAAEIAISSYVRTYFPKNGNVRIGIGRAGNVIGGGDWATHRIVPDCMRAWSKNKPVLLRNSFSTRPWQHVLEPISGYLTLACNLSDSFDLHGEAFNFGPTDIQDYSVEKLVKNMAKYWDKVKWIDKTSEYMGPKESGLLKLNCDKAFHLLGWRPVWNFFETVEYTAKWYKNYYSDEQNISDLSESQIINYFNKANQIELLWTK